jgi:preprotein translocase subunit YajC
MLLDATKSSGSSLLIVLYVVLFALFYFGYMRPKNRKQKAAREQARQVAVGDRVQTIGGLVGTIVSDDGVLLTIRTASGSELDFVKGAISQKFQDPTVPSIASPEESGELSDAPEGE